MASRKAWAEALKRPCAKCGAPKTDGGAELPGGEIEALCYPCIDAANKARREILANRRKERRENAPICDAEDCKKKAFHKLGGVCLCKKHSENAKIGYLAAQAGHGIFAMLYPIQYSRENVLEWAEKSATGTIR